MSNRTLLLRTTLLLSVALIAAGLLVGLLSISVPALDGSLNCGSALEPSEYQANIAAQNIVTQAEGQQPIGAELVADCNSKRSDRKTEALVILAAGVIVGAGGIFSFSDARKPPSQPH